MKILSILNSRRDSPAFLLNNPRMFSKGFIRTGHDVFEFDYREMLLQQSPLKSKIWALRLAKRKTDHRLAELARHYQPDVVFISTFKLLDTQTIQGVRTAAPEAKYVCWHGDHLDQLDPRVAEIARLCDWFLATSGGELLSDYAGIGVPHCAFLPNPCDPDVQGPRPVDEAWRTELLFTGKMKHGQGEQDPLRWELVQHLLAAGQLTLYGDLGRPVLQGADYLSAICGARIALSINAYNHVRFYHSDRLIHYLSCGAFVIAKRVPDSELLFEHERHLCYFDTMAECLSLIERYQGDEAARRAIAKEGLEHARNSFNCTKLAGYIIDLLEQGRYDEPWCEVL